MSLSSMLSRSISFGSTRGEKFKVRVVLIPCRSLGLIYIYGVQDLPLLAVVSLPCGSFLFGQILLAKSVAWTRGPRFAWAPHCHVDRSTSCVSASAICLLRRSAISVCQVTKGKHDILHVCSIWHDASVSFDESRPPPFALVTELDALPLRVTRVIFLTVGGWGDSDPSPELPREAVHLLVELFLRHVASWLQQIGDTLRLRANVFKHVRQGGARRAKALSKHSATTSGCTPTVFWRAVPGASLLEAMEFLQRLLVEYLLLLQLVFQPFVLPCTSFRCAL